MVELRELLIDEPPVVAMPAPPAPDMAFPWLELPRPTLDRVTIRGGSLTFFKNSIVLRNRRHRAGISVRTNGAFYTCQSKALECNVVGSGKKIRAAVANFVIFQQLQRFLIAMR